jgi:IclR family transcriptional regulator, acetate operon repressor
VTGEREPISRAIDVLSWLAANPTPPWGVRHVARGLDMSPTTVHRIFGIFENRGLLEKDDENSYLPGLELYRICHSVAAQMSPVRLARQHLEALCAECDETVLFGAYDAKRAQMMFIDTVPTSHPVQYLSKLNHWMPIHSGATGLAIFASLPDVERKSIYAAGLTSLTDRTLTTEDAVEGALEAVRRRGFAYSHGQRTVGAVGFAAPVFDADGHVFGDVCVTIPEQRFAEPMTETIGAAVLATSRIVTRELSAAGFRRGIA